MSRPCQRRQRGGQEQQSSRRWLFISGAGLSGAAVLVVALLAVLGVFKGEEPPPDRALSPRQMQSLALAGHSEGAPDAPVILLEFGDFQ